MVKGIHEQDVNIIKMNDAPPPISVVFTFPFFFFYLTTTSQGISTSKEQDNVPGHPLVHRRPVEQSRRRLGLLLSQLHCVIS